MRFRGGIKKDSKGYLTITAGPQRGKRVHTLVAEAMLGRELATDEEVHHRNGNKLDSGWRNLQVLGKSEHGAVSARQSWYFRTNDIKAKQEWDKYFDGEGHGQQSPPPRLSEDGETSFP